jgi:hypothetical protein
VYIDVDVSGIPDTRKEVFTLGEEPPTPLRRNLGKRQVSVHLGYGKLPPSTFTGSLYGAGADVFALWGYVIANAYKGTIELNPIPVAHILGCEPEQVDAAINYLSQPDPERRNMGEDGRHLVREGQWQYRVIADGF